MKVAMAVADNHDHGTHKRCLFRVKKESVLGRRGPTGHPNGLYGIWQVRRCVYCGSTSSRWKPGISTTSAYDALDQNRPASIEALNRRDRRDQKLLELERRHLPEAPVVEKMKAE